MDVQVEGGGVVSTGHAPPFYCPYCGEEDIRPDAEGHGQWRCEACLRAWSLRFLGVTRPSGTTPSAPAGDPVAVHAAASATVDAQLGKGLA